MVTDGLAARLVDLEREFAECEARLGDPEVIADQKRYVELSRRYSELGPIAAAKVFCVSFKRVRIASGPAGSSASSITCRRVSAAAVATILAWSK